MHGAHAHFDFLFGEFDIAGIRISRQVLVRPGVAADRHAGLSHHLGNFRMPGGVLADLEEGRLEALIGQRLDDGRRIARPRPVVEGQNDFVLVQEIVLLEVFEAECRAARGVDLHRAGNPHGAGLVAARGGRFGGATLCACRRRRRRRGGRARIAVLHLGEARRSDGRSGCGRSDGRRGDRRLQRGGN